MNYECLEKGYAEYERILLNFYKNPNTAPYIDNDFHPHKIIFENSIELDPTVIWKRIDDIYPIPLFQNDLIHPNYVNQGNLGDDYLISALSHISKEKYKIQSLFECDKPNAILGVVSDSINLKSGAVLIYLHSFGQRIPVLIDTLIPCKNNDPLLSYPKEGKSPWFCLVEKAYAKLKGSYSSINGGFFGEAMFALNGYCYPKFLNLKDDRTKVINEIMKYVKCGFPMDASIRDSNAGNDLSIHGLYPNHSYLVLNVLEIEGNRFFFLRNPWGKKVWNGDYSKKSPLLTPSLYGKLKNKIADGAFYMIEKDFLEYFTSIEVVKTIDPRNICHCCKCCIQPSANLSSESLEKNQVFCIRLTDQIENGKSVKFVVLFERQKKLNERFPRNYSVVAFVRTNGQEMCQKIFANSNYSRNDTIEDVFSVSSSFEKINDSFALALCNVGDDQSEQVYFVRVFCEKNFELYNIDEQNFKLYYKQLQKTIAKILNKT